MKPGAISQLMRYWETVRHLRPGQIHGRIAFRLARPAPDHSPAPPRRPLTGTWHLPARRMASLTGPDTFLFLNEKGSLGELGWDNAQRDKLWRYNQHYFDDLNAHAADTRQDWHSTLLSAWIEGNPAGQGTGWEPYPTSLRIVNWIKWRLGGGQPPEGMTQSLAVQARWLCRRLEHHLLGNHLFANAKALIFAGLWFDGEEASRWRSCGFAILQREFDEQIRADGGQFELSPMYHALALEDVLDLINITALWPDVLTPAQAAQVAHWRSRVPDMATWLLAMSHHDGKIAFFNDAAFGIAPETSELLAYAGRLGIDIPRQAGAPVWLKESGYVRLENTDAALIADIAHVGPDYLPGHAHADTLSFELSLLGQRVIVNSGTSLYGTGAERHRQRGTPAHSTLAIAGENSSDVWSGFRVGRRARPSLDAISLDPDGQSLSASHDGYRYRPGKPVHQRRWTLTAHTLVIEDEITAPERNPAKAFFHFHPAITARMTGETAGQLTLPSGRVVSWRAGGGAARLRPSSWHPQFGLSQPSACLVLPLANGKARLELDWGG
jgi:uncharacterized heparinase superfamily protein